MLSPIALGTFIGEVLGGSSEVPIVKGPSTTVGDDTSGRVSYVSPGATVFPFGWYGAGAMASGSAVGKVAGAS